jgi:hypothetical protein
LTPKRSRVDATDPFLSSKSDWIEKMCHKDDFRNSHSMGQGQRRSMEALRRARLRQNFDLEESSVHSMRGRGGNVEVLQPKRASSPSGPEAKKNNDVVTLPLRHRQQSENSSRFSIVRRLASNPVTANPLRRPSEMLHHTSVHSMSGRREAIEVSPPKSPISPPRSDADNNFRNFCVTVAVSATQWKPNSVLDSRTKCFEFCCQ